MNLFSNTWDLILIFLIFIGCAILTIKLAKMLRIGSKRSLLLYIWHTFFCCIYAIYSLYNVSDSTEYYQQALIGHVSLSFGTAFVSYISVLLVKILGLSYLATFLVYNFFGTIGLLCVDASLKIAVKNKSKQIRHIASFIVLLPSMSFWSSALGKDSLAFMATGIALWAALNLRNRIWLMAISILVMLAVRPHMAGMLIISLSASQILQRKIPLTQRITFGCLTIVASILMIPIALNYSGIGENVNATTLESYISQRQQANLGGGSSIDIASMSIPMQLLSYMFRPQIYEADSLFALVVAVENFALLALFVYGGWVALKHRKRELQGDTIFMSLYSLLAWGILATTTANMGIAVRQKWMFAPMLIFLIISVIGKSRPHTPGVKAII